MAALADQLLEDLSSAVEAREVALREAEAKATVRALF
jgi:hypothetical protein